jgi:hypothetical protein
VSYEIAELFLVHGFAHLVGFVVPTSINVLILVYLTAVKALEWLPVLGG